MRRDFRAYTLTLTEAVEALAQQELPSVELAADQLARIRATDAAVCAWVTLDPDHVLDEAKRWDAALMPGRLGGIGIGIKDIINTADLPTTMGSPIFADHRPLRDAACVTRLKAAGAFVFGKTVTTPFAFMDPGKTRNPWDPAHTPGGSSSGSAPSSGRLHFAASSVSSPPGTPFRSMAYIDSARRSIRLVPSRGRSRTRRDSQVRWLIPAALPDS